MKYKKWWFNIVDQEDIVFGVKVQDGKITQNDNELSQEFRISSSPDYATRESNKFHSSLMNVFKVIISRAREKKVIDKTHSKTSNDVD